MSATLIVEGLTKRYGETVACRNVSFAAHSGRVLGLLGPNGAGKTTAIRVIMGILRAEEGRIFLFGDSDVAAGRHRVGYLPEERGLYDDVKVIDNLSYLGQLKGMDGREARRSALAWLQRLELDEWSDSKLNQLSKGMQQKVQFIAAVLHDPELLVLDEPFGGLDPVNQDVFKGLIREMQDAGKTILLSAHQMNVVEELCDSIFLINRGRRVLYGTLEDIKRNFEDSVVSVTHAPGEDTSFVDRIEGAAVTERGRTRMVFRYSGSAPPRDVIAELTDHLNVMEITFTKPPLHDIFIQTVRERGDSVEETTIV